MFLNRSPLMANTPALNSNYETQSLIQNLLFAQHLRIQRAAVLFPVKGPVQAIIAGYIGLQKDTFRRCGGLAENENYYGILVLYGDYRKENGNYQDY